MPKPVKSKRQLLKPKVATVKKKVKTKPCPNLAKAFDRKAKSYKGVDFSKALKAKKPVEELPRRAVEVVAFIADCHGVHGTDVKELLERKPELCRIFNIKPEEVTHQTAVEADQHNRKEFDKLVKKYGANKPKVLPKEYS